MISPFQRTAIKIGAGLGTMDMKYNIGKLNRKIFSKCGIYVSCPGKETGRQGFYGAAGEKE